MRIDTDRIAARYGRRHVNSIGTVSCARMQFELALRLRPRLVRPQRRFSKKLSAKSIYTSFIAQNAFTAIVCTPFLSPLRFAGRNLTHCLTPLRVRYVTQMYFTPTSTPEACAPVESGAQKVHKHEIDSSAIVDVNNRDFMAAFFLGHVRGRSGR